MSACPAAFRLADGTIAGCRVTFHDRTAEGSWWHRSDEVDGTILEWLDDSPFATEDQYVIDQHAHQAAVLHDR